MLTGEWSGEAPISKLSVDDQGNPIAADFSATLDQYDYVGGRTLVQQSGSVQFPGTGTLKITSPPPDSTVALTDTNATLPPSQARTSRPNTRELKSDWTASCAGPLTINDVVRLLSRMAPGRRNSPITALGPVTLTASAPGCGKVTNNDTLINLQITSPAENASQPVTATPNMPGLNATPSVAGYPGDTSAVSLNWTLQARGKR